jgi:hypothetical protein
MHGTYRGVQFERSVVARNTVIGKFFRDRKDAKDSSVALLDIGVIPYYAAMKTHSITGIVDTHIAHNAVSRVPIGRGLPGHEKVDVAHALSKRPTYIVLDTVLDVEPESSPEYPDWITEAGIGEDVLQQYRFASVLLHDPVNGETGHFTFLELKTSDGR